MARGSQGRGRLPQEGRLPPAVKFIHVLLFSRNVLLRYEVWLGRAWREGCGRGCRVRGTVWEVGEYKQGKEAKETVEGVAGGRVRAGFGRGVEERQVLGKAGAGLVEEGRGRAGQGCDGTLPWPGPARHSVPSVHLSEGEKWRALGWEAGNSRLRRTS